MKLKTNELLGAALDWAVARAEGHAVKIGGGKNTPLVYYANTGGSLYAPSRQWAQGGPIIDRENITTGRTPSWVNGELSLSSYWMAYQPSTLDDDNAPESMRGETPLIAAMRCYVASKFGETVEMPDELTE